jgi:hypothetical protein
MIILIAIIIFSSSSPFQAEEGSISAASIQQERILVPIDEADQNPDFKAFRDSLLAAVERKDLDFLLDHVDDQIRVSFGTDQGKVDFVRFWKLNEQPEESRIWAELKEVLRLGGTFRGEERTSFTAPYLFNRFPKGFDEFLYAAIIDSVVYLREEPDSSSAVLDTLRYSIVKKASVFWTREDSWSRVETLSGIEGYVEGRSARSPLDFRANFTKKNSKWKMIFFVAGD